MVGRKCSANSLVKRDVKTFACISCQLAACHNHTQRHNEKYYEAESGLQESQKATETKAEEYKLLWLTGSCLLVSTGIYW